uniref:Uncharacterized protein n=1 Tax=Macaca nemestrina TaxID=9545 RepID=A0A2K6B903_MACNE
MSLSPGPDIPRTTARWRQAPTVCGLVSPQFHPGWACDTPKRRRGLWIGSPHPGRGESIGIWESFSFGRLPLELSILLAAVDGSPFAHSEIFLN